MNKTFAMIKPSTVKDKKVGQIIHIIEDNDFDILQLKLTKMSYEEACKFYYIHRDRPFYKDLCEFMSSGPVVAMALQKDNAVTSFRELIGATNPSDAKAGTIRKLFGKSIDENAIHGSDSDDNAEEECKFFFG